MSKPSPNMLHKLLASFVAVTRMEHFKGIDRKFMVGSLFFSTHQVLQFRLLAFPVVLEGLGSSGKGFGTISAYHGTSPTPW